MAASAQPHIPDDGLPGSPGVTDRAAGEHERSGLTPSCTVEYGRGKPLDHVVRSGAQNHPDRSSVLGGGQIEGLRPDASLDGSPGCRQV